MEWFIGAFVVFALVAVVVAAWRAEPRGRGRGLSRRSSLFGGPLGPGVYGGIDQKERLDIDDRSGSVDTSPGSADFTSGG